MNPEQELRQDIKDIRSDMSEMKTDIALIKQSLAGRAEQGKLRVSLFVAGLGFLGGIISSLIGKLVGS